MPTVTAALKTSQVIHSICCSTHKSSTLRAPPPFLLYMLGLTAKQTRTRSVSSQEKCCALHNVMLLQVNGGSGNRALKKQDPWYCTTAMADLAPAASPPYNHTATHQVLPPQLLSLREAEYLLIQIAGQLIMTGHEYPGSCNSNHSARITWGRDPQQCPFY